MRFHIQQDSDIPASTQLYNQICFAIAARHYPPGHRLPSTRQLAMQTGLHRNTISKVYRQLEIDGGVEAIAGSGAGGLEDAGGNIVGIENHVTTAGSFTVTNGKNLVTGGPFTIASGHTVTVGSGETWTVV